METAATAQRADREIAAIRRHREALLQATGHPTARVPGTHRPRPARASHTWHAVT